MPTITKDILARTVSELLDLPYDRRQGKAYEIVKAVIQALRVALLRGEQVSIGGFGIFKIRHRASSRRLAYFYPYLRKKGLYHQVLETPAKNHVHFQPSKVLLRLLNEKVIDNVT